MEVIAQVNNQPLVRDAEFCRLVIPLSGGGSNIYTFSTSYKSETVDSITFTPLGGLLAIGTIQHDLSVTSFDMTLSLSGIGSENIYAVLANQIKGSKVEIWRGFYTDTYVLQTPLVKRYTGIVTSYSISEERQERDDNFTVSLNCSSYKLILENKINGRKTNPRSWNSYSTSVDDSSMVNVPQLDKAYFDFGAPVK